MQDSLDKKIKDMASRESIRVPKGFDERMERIKVSLPQERKGQKTKRFPLRAAVILAAALVLCAANIPMGVFLYMGYYKSIPREIDESAMLDGCGCIRMFAAVIFPLLKPITVTLFIITFMAIWNDFGTTIYFLNSSSNFTLTLTVYNFFGVHSADWNLVFANVIAVSAPVVLVYFLAQKQIISGMTAGAVKG